MQHPVNRAAHDRPRPAALILSALFIVFAALLPGVAARADFSRPADYSGSGDFDRFEQRQRYQDALHLIRSNRLSRYRKLKPQLRAYPLFPYLEYTALSRRLAQQSDADIAAFLQRYRDTPLPGQLLPKWLASLAARGRWDSFLAHYKSDRLPASNRQLACQHGRALYRSGRTDEADARARELWLVAFSQPEQCDPVFKTWRARGGLTDAIAWQRFALSLHANERTLASYLLRFIGKKDRPYANNFLLVQARPAVIKRIAAFRKRQPRNREIILYGVNRLARTDPAGALAALHNYRSLQNFDARELEAAYARAGIYLAQQSDRAEQLENLPVNLHRQPQLVEARIRQALRAANWNDVLVLIHLLPAAARESPRWRYWKARVLAQSDQATERKIATDILLELSRERTFYGFISADILGRAYHYQDQPRPVTAQQIHVLEQTPGLQRALELFALGQRAQARREWYFTTAALSGAEREIAAQVALRWGWYKVAIQSLIDAGARNQLNFRFPLGYRDSFLTQARRSNIPLSWGLAIARQESAFMPDARSPSGALGVMQLLPSTARQVAKQLGVRYAHSGSLMQPALNIQLGTHYLGQMLRKFANNRIVASAAYNAGPNRVSRWLNPALPFDVWIESIPIEETRLYVQNVLMFASIYSRKLARVQPLIYPHERAFFAAQQSGLSGSGN